MASGVKRRCHVVVVGAGNAALTAALAAREKGADVLVVEKAPLKERGGNSRFTIRAAQVSCAELSLVVSQARTPPQKQ